MKYLISVAFGIILLVSACNQETTLLQSQKELVKIPSKISIDEALKNADILFSSLERNTRSKTRTVKSIQTIGLNNGTRSSETSGKPQYYLVNYENDEGFAVLSADKRLGTVFAIAEDGNLSLEDTIGNPGLANFFSGLDKMANSLSLRDSLIVIGPSNPIDSIYQLVVEWSVPPKMPPMVQKWPGSEQYGLSERYSPVAISIAQIMATFARPNKWIYYANNTGNYPKIELNWPSIQKHQFSQNTTDGLTKVKELFDLITHDFCYCRGGGEIILKPGIPSYEIYWNESFHRRGYNVGCYYGDKTPGGIGRYEDPFLSSHKEWRDALDEDKLPLACDDYQGQTEYYAWQEYSDSPDHSKFCHFWVVDGYIKYNEPFNSIMKEHGIDIMFHCVWGKGGKNNGYFVILNKMIPISSESTTPISDPYPDSGDRTIYYYLIEKNASYYEE